MTRGTARTDWQKAVVARLRVLTAQVHELSLIGPIVKNGDHLDAVIALDLSSLKQVAGGLPLEDVEQFTIHIPPDAFRPPLTSVDHWRFLGYPHVLGGHTLCLYLDPSREWNPTEGITGHLNQLWQWLTDAANNEFDADTALYHAVGGFTHYDPNTPVVVVRSNLPDRGRVHAGHLVARGGRRMDYRFGPSTDPTQPATPSYILRDDLPFGAGRQILNDLLDRLNHADSQQASSRLVREPRQRFKVRLASLTALAVTTPSACNRAPRAVQLWQAPTPVPLLAPSTGNGLLTALAAAATRQPDGAPQDVLIGVPHPTGGPHHLLCLRLPATAADALRAVVRRRSTPVINIHTSDIADDIDMEWCYVSDERPETTVRRDEGRPVNALIGANIQIWGCGGLGSWIAEFAVRAGAASVTVCDPGMVTGGLLVRQNYTEADVAGSKAEALAARLRGISDTADIIVRKSPLPESFNTAMTSADLVIDATVNHSIGLIIDGLSTNTGRTATVAKVATDVRTGTLGLAIVSVAGGPAPCEVDLAAGIAVQADPALEDYRTFWDEPGSGDELTPTRGCSAPTFHGSAADMAAIAGTLFNLVAASHRGRVSGTHVCALPYAGVKIGHRHIPHQQP